MDRAAAIAGMQLGKELGDDLRLEVQAFAMRLKHKLRLERRERIRRRLVEFAAGFGRRCQAVADLEGHEYSANILVPDALAPNVLAPDAHLVAQWVKDALTLLPKVLSTTGLEDVTFRVITVEYGYHVPGDAIKCTLNWALEE
eukprot:TRINITY_DN35105_c0_g1_i1.p2 TRINITY_DN35105_c0_g1~~TRINITY_DN35105_c0_g1_i1.p2  ORF type:complete len:143 (+),score=35.59 TRINITY_DN35105_c0_g1_i1:86-514(+)